MVEEKETSGGFDGGGDEAEIIDNEMGALHRLRRQ